MVRDGYNGLKSFDRAKVFCMRNPEHAWTREVERVAARVMA